MGNALGALGEPEPKALFGRRRARGRALFTDWPCVMSDDKESVPIVPRWRNDLSELQETLDKLQIERFKLIGLLEEHLSPDIVKELLEGNQPQKLGGRRETVAVLFCDLRGFTRFTAARPADEVVAHLNQFFHSMTTVLFSHQATVDKFIGDAILAFFQQRETPIGELAKNAAACALRMRESFGALSDVWHAGKALGLGMALSIGEVILGQVGSGRHVDFTIIGSPVNMASRLCALAGPGEIIVTKEFVEALGDTSGWVEMPPQQIKGFDEPVKAFANR